MSDGSRRQARRLAGDRPRSLRVRVPRARRRTDRNRHGSLFDPRRPEGLYSSAGQGGVSVAGAPVHPDRGGDGEAFVKLCAAYRKVLAELEDATIGGRGPVATPSGRDEACRRDRGPLGGVTSPGCGRSPRSPPVVRRAVVAEGSCAARAWLLGLIGLCGVLSARRRRRWSCRRRGRARRGRGPPGSRPAASRRPGRLAGEGSPAGLNRTPRARISHHQVRCRNGHRSEYPNASHAEHAETDRGDFGPAQHPGLQGDLGRLCERISASGLPSSSASSACSALRNPARPRPDRTCPGRIGSDRSESG